MKGNFKLKRINKKTGESEVILEEDNQVAAGFATAITNVLTSTGSRDKNDYLFRYFQLGDDNYNLSSYGVSADVPEARLKTKVWTMKSPLDLSGYGRNSVLPVVQREIYGLGSIRPYYKDKLFDNFIDPPDDTNQIAEYTNQFDGPIDPEPHGQARYTQQKTVWVNGCANAWEQLEENHFHYPLWISAADISISGPTLTAPVYAIQYNGSAIISNLNSACFRVDTGYQNYKGETAEDTQDGVWHHMKKDQTSAAYVTAKYYTSAGGGPNLTSNPLTGGITLFNRSAQALVTNAAGQNKMTFKYRYNLEYDSTEPEAEWYPPYILPWETGTGYDLANPGVQEDYDAVYGAGVGAGVLSGNVECSAGEMYIYGGNGIDGDVVNAEGTPWRIPSDGRGPYSTMTGPGFECSGQPNSGFGPSGNWYRVSVSWMDVPDEVLNYNDGVVKGAVMQNMNYPIVSSLKDVVVPTDSDYTGPDYWGNLYAVSGNKKHDHTPRAVAYWANQSIEYSKTATPYQYRHAESPYYITKPQYFIQIPEGYSTSLNDNTINIRLFLDEYLANGRTLKEVAMFLKNPGGKSGEDAPYMGAYKVFDPPVEKNSEFSYIIDWELSVIDTDNI